MTTFLYKRLFLLLLTMLMSSVMYASGIDDILKMKEEPAGVVFELLESENDDWDWAIPKVESYTKSLRLRFPNLPVVIVSHGQEQFMLLKSEAGENKQRHHALQSFMSSNDVDVHVCGVHGSWFGNTPEDFVDFIDVSASAPAQINDYLKLDYKRIMLEKSD